MEGFAVWVHAAAVDSEKGQPVTNGLPFSSLPIRGCGYLSGALRGKWLLDSARLERVRQANSPNDLLFVFFFFFIKVSETEFIPPAPVGD